MQSDRSEQKVLQGFSAGRPRNTLRFNALRYQVLVDKAVKFLAISDMKVVPVTVKVETSL